MLKKFLTGWQMSEAAFVQQAAIWSRELTRMRSRGPGDTDNTMHTIEREYGVDYWTQWSLRYRLNRVKEIGCAAYARIEAAYYAERQRQFNKLKSDIGPTEEITGPDNIVVRTVRSVVGEDVE